MKSWKTRLGLVLTMLAMVLAVSVPAMADHDEEELAFEVEVEDCELVSTGNDDFDELEDEDELDGIDQDGDLLDGEDGYWVVCEVEYDFDDDALEGLSFDEFEDLSFDDDDDDDDDDHDDDDDDDDE